MSRRRRVETWAAVGLISLIQVTAADAQTTDDDSQPTYYFAEGATGSFFDFDIALANPNAVEANVTLKFLLPDGEAPITVSRTLSPQSRTTIHVDELPGLEERSGVSADTAASSTTATVRFLLEPTGVVTKTYDLLPNSRLTVYAGAIPELVGRSFGMEVNAAAPIFAERSTYFGSARLWDGGHNSTGVPAPALFWFFAEGATGPFFETFLTLANPTNQEAHVQVDYLSTFGPGGVGRMKTVPANARLTINIEREADSLSNAAVSTRVQSDVPIVPERVTYWPDPATTWSESHSTFGVGVTDWGVKLGLAEGRVGGPENFETYVLIANPL